MTTPEKVRKGVRVLIVLIILYVIAAVIIIGGFMYLDQRRYGVLPKEYLYFYFGLLLGAVLFPIMFIALLAAAVKFGTPKDNRGIIKDDAPDSKHGSLVPLDGDDSDS
jgi:TRAP-type C4-dicarboxylate transport system permease small subunit